MQALTWSPSLFESVKAVKQKLNQMGNQQFELSQSEKKILSQIMKQPDDKKVQDMW
ncbi:MAG: hypothetical protein K0R57_5446 [Paenibacillaceae bacterium]|jgi:hypothetical protein|nr:hypothetical protein [Paenibacillaceae bacterium]